MLTDALSLFLAAARLATAITSLHPEVPADRVPVAALAIVLAADDVFGPELVAAIAVRESKLLPSAYNARSSACSTMQVIIYPARERRRRCAAMRADASGLTGYREGVERLHAWQVACWHRRTPGLRCVLRGYGGQRSVAGVLWRMGRLRAAMGGRPGTAPAKGPTS